MPLALRQVASGPMARLREALWRKPLAAIGNWFRVHGLFPLVLFVVTRLTYMGMSAIGLALVPGLYYHPEGRQRFLQPYPALDGLCRWDCGWFVRLVQEGYSTPENAKIFPLFPLIGWSIEKITGIHHLIVFLVVSNLASLASYYVIFHIFRQFEGEEPARWALLLMVTYPFAYFQAAAQPESLMILLTAVSLLLAYRGRHIWAGVVLGLGVMARHVAIFFGPALLVAQLRQRGFHPRRFLLSPAVLGLVAPFAFVAAFAWYLKERVGDPLAFWNARTIGWGEMVWWGWRETFTRVVYLDRPEFYFYLLFGIVVWIGAIALLTRKRWLELAAASLTSLIIFYQGAVIGLGRYTAGVWPAFLPLGVFLAKRPLLQGPVIAAFALFQGLFFFLFSHQFRVF